MEEKEAQEKTPKVFSSSAERKDNTKFTGRL